MRDIGDLRLAMEGAFEVSGSSPGERSVARSTLSRPVAWVATAVAVVAALVVGVLTGRAWFGGLAEVAPQGVTRLTVNIPPEQHLSGGFAMEERAFAFQRPSRTSFDLSPDGRELVYAALRDLDSSGESLGLYRRSMAETQIYVLILKNKARSLQKRILINK